MFADVCYWFQKALLHSNFSSILLMTLTFTLQLQFQIVSITMPLLFNILYVLFIIQECNNHMPMAPKCLKYLSTVSWQYIRNVFYSVVCVCVHIIAFRCIGRQVQSCSTLYFEILAFVSSLELYKPL